MVGPVMDLLCNPLGVVRGLFSKAAAAVPALDLSRSDWGVKAVFDKFLYEDGAVEQVPQIADFPLESIPNGSLVRFRGMIQDMFDMEYYVGAYKDSNASWHTNKYTDSASAQDTEQEIWDRRLFYCVPIPGENQWIKEAWSSDLALSNGVGRSLKRKRGDLEGMDCDPQFKEQLPCIVKIYDGGDGELKLNDIAEFVGVVANDPGIISASPCDLPLSGEYIMEDDTFSQLPYTTVPRLHCITWRKLSAYSLPRRHPYGPETSMDLHSTRESLVCKLQTVLGEDKLAAEYLLLHLLSQVHNRVEPLAIGKFSLNFTGCEAGANGSLSPFAAALSNAISMLLPCSLAMPLSLENLNSSSLAPRKDYTTNRLVTGGLQLAGGTHLTLDETALNTGKLNETGVRNLQCLKSLLEAQKVDYDFQYYQMEMSTDLPVLVVSCGKSRLLPADALVPLRCSTDVAPMRAEKFELSKWRTYLSIVREADHVIEPSMQKIIEDDLVAARQKDRTIGPDTFHRWLTMARLLSLSYGEKSLTCERWEMMKDLETRCAARLSS